ncbi:MAG: hypothetical protein EBZ89_15245, partial [Chloroflexi bacterium]|nr:hypothetical protein [Chloroflexota bacterium]
MRPLILVPTVFEAVQVFGEIARGPLSTDGHATARYLLRDDGEYEVHIRESVSDPSPVDLAPALERERAVEVAIEVCGFGLAASGIGAMNALAREGRLSRPSGSEYGEPSPGGRPATILIGIAGSYDLGAAPVGSVVIGSRATCDGIGAGTGNEFVAAGAMGWSQ